MNKEIAQNSIENIDLFKYYGSGLRIFKDHIIQNAFFEKGKDGEPEEIEIICKFVSEKSLVLFNKTTVQLIETDNGIFLLGLDEYSVILNGDIEFYEMEDQMIKSKTILQKLRLINSEINKKIVSVNEIEDVVKYTKLKQNIIIGTINNIRFRFETKEFYENSIKICIERKELINRIIIQVNNAIDLYDEEIFEIDDPEKQYFDDFLKNTKEIAFLLKNIHVKLEKYEIIVNNLLKLYKVTN